MSQLSRTFAQFAMGLVVSMAAGGCATSSDLEALKVDLTRKLDAQTTKLRGDIGKLHDEAKSLRTEMQTLRTQVGSFQPDIKRMVEVQNEQDIMRTLMAKELTSAITNTRKAMDNYSANITTLGSDIRSLNAALRGSYELDEEALKGRLRAVEEMKRRLGLLETRQ